MTVQALVVPGQAMLLLPRGLRRQCDLGTVCLWNVAGQAVLYLPLSPRLRRELILAF